MTYLYQPIISLFSWLSTWSLLDFQTLTNILQDITVIIATLFTAWWAYSTFGHKEKTDELMAIAKKIAEIHTFIDGGVSEFRLHEILMLSTSSIPDTSNDEEMQKYTDQTKKRKIDIDILLSELETLQFLSFRVPIAFRVLDMIEYKSYIRSHLDFEKLAKDKIASSEMIGVKHKILHDIEKEVNAHRNFLRRISIKFQNIVYHTRRFFKRKNKSDLKR